MKICLFVGPTLHAEAVPAAIDCYGPAMMGSVYRAVEAGYRRIGIVDGVFGDMPSVWHKEILYAIAAGIEVAGAASMGALRAAELSRYGMAGIGRVYRLFRCGRWADDDEVAVLHAPSHLGYRPLSEAMCNIRFTLRRLRRAGVIARPVETALVAGMKSTHFSQRTTDELRRQIAEVAGRAATDRIADTFERRFVDIKKDDARALLAYLSRRFAGPPSTPDWQFPTTCHWRKQFERDLAEVPPLIGASD